MAKTFTFDANGNLTGDGTHTFEWDARNQLIAVTVGAHRSEFTCDWLQRQVRRIEKDDGAVESDTRVLWCQTAICDESGADGATVRRRARVRHKHKQHRRIRSSQTFQHRVTSLCAGA